MNEEGKRYLEIDDQTDPDLSEMTKLTKEEQIALEKVSTLLVLVAEIEDFIGIELRPSQIFLPTGEKFEIVYPGDTRESLSGHTDVDLESDKNGMLNWQKYSQNAPKRLSRCYPPQKEKRGPQ